MRKQYPSIAFVRERFSYDPNTGDLTWAKARRDYLGRVAGYQEDDGYIRVTIGNDRYHAHRLIWAIVHDEYPEEIDHRNGVRSDNRIKNLRACTRSENHQNRGDSSNNTTGFRGVTYDKANSRFLARIGHNYKQYHLGSFIKPEDAAAAYKRAKKQLHGFQPTVREGTPCVG